MPHAFTWRADPESWRWRLDLLEQLLACYQQALGHKLSNQLISIGGLANLLQQEVGDRLDGEARARLARVVALTRETAELAGALTALGRLCRDSEPCTMIDLAAAVHEAATQVKMLNPRQSIGYDLQEKIAVNVPRGPLHLALVQLLRFAGDGGLSNVQVTAEAAAQGIALHVEAAGPSLSEKELTLLFQRLTSGARAAELGLDLFLVRQAAALWGGGVSLQAEPGRGTRFTLWFPNP